MEDFNLLVTYDPIHSAAAKNAIKGRLEDIGIPVETIQETSVEGLLGLRIKEDPKQVVSELRSLCQEDPGLFTHTYHWVPIERWVPATDDSMTKAASELAKGIGENESWMMHMHKRHHGEHSKDLIKKLTDPINKGAVNLKNPDRILVVEILGDKAGLALLEKGELLDINSVRQELASRQIL